MIDNDLQQALTAVKARSAHHRRVRRAWAGTGCAVLIGAAGVGIVSATSAERAVSVASEPTMADGPTTSVDGDQVAGTSSAEAPGTTVTTENTPTTSVAAPLPSTTVAPNGGPPTTTAVVDDPPPTTPGPTQPTTTAPLEAPPGYLVPGTPTPLAEARALWAAKGPDSYRMTLQRLCFCGSIAPFAVTVIDGVVQPGADGAVSIDEILDQASSIGPEGRIVDLFVDRATGVPTWVDLDFVTMAADDEMTYVITNFVVIASDDG